MEPAAGLLLEHQMDLMTGHPTFEIFRGGDSESLHSFDQAVLEKLDRLECTIGLLGEDQGDVSQLALTAVQCELRNVALVLAEQTDRAFQTVELLEDSLIERMQALGIASPEDFERRMSGHEVHLMLKEKTSGWLHIGSITLINSEGRLFNFSRFWPIPDITVVDRDFFQALKSNAQLKSFMGQPVRNRATGTWTIHLVRKLAAPDGEFLGLVLGAMEMEYFEQFFATIALAKESSISLFRSDGMLLARHPHVEPAAAPSYPQSGLPANILSRADQGPVRQIGSIDGEERVIVAHRLAHYPFVVMLTTTVSANLTY